MEGGIESLQDSFNSLGTPYVTPSPSFSAEADDDDLSRRFCNVSIGSSFDLAEGASLSHTSDTVSVRSSQELPTCSPVSFEFSKSSMFQAIASTGSVSGSSSTRSRLGARGEEEKEKNNMISSLKDVQPTTIFVSNPSEEEEEYQSFENVSIYHMSENYYYYYVHSSESPSFSTSIVPYEATGQPVCLEVGQNHHVQFLPRSSTRLSAEGRGRQEDKKNELILPVNQSHPIFVSSHKLPVIKEELKGEEKPEGSEDGHLPDQIRSDSEGEPDHEESDDEPSSTDSSVYSYDIGERPYYLEIEEVPSFRWLSDSFRSIPSDGCSSLSTGSYYTSGGAEEEGELSFPIILAGMVQKAAEEAVVFKEECLKLGNLADELAKNLRSMSLIATAHRLLCIRLLLSVRHISEKSSKSLRRALALCNRCGRGGSNQLFRKISVVSFTDFQNVSSLLEASILNMEWPVSIVSAIITTMSPDTDLSVPPNPVNSDSEKIPMDPLHFWFGTRSIVRVLKHGGSALSGHINAINFLAILASEDDNAPLVAAVNFLITLTSNDDGNKDIIIRKGAVPALSRLLIRDPSVDLQLVVVIALKNLAGFQATVSAIQNARLVPCMIKILSYSSVDLQIHVASLLLQMAAYPTAAQELVSENAIYTLLILLSGSSVSSGGSNINYENNIGIASSSQENELQALCTNVLHLILKNNLETEYAMGHLLFIVEGNENPTKLRIHATYTIGSLFDVMPKSELQGTIAPLVLQLGDEDLEVATATASTLLPFTLVDDLHHHVCKEIMQCHGIGMIERLVESDHDDARSAGLKLLTALKMSYPPNKLVMVELLRVVQDVSQRGKTKKKDVDVQRTSRISAIYVVGCLAGLMPSEEIRDAIAPLVVQMDNEDYHVRDAATSALYCFAERSGLQLDIHEAIIHFGGKEMLETLSWDGTYQSKLLLSSFSDLFT